MKPAPVKGHSGWARGRPPPGKLVQTLARKKVRTVLKWQDKNLSYPWGPGIPTEKANLCHQKHELTSIGEDVETGAPVGCGGDLSWGSCCEKQDGVALKSQNQNNRMIQQAHQRLQIQGN